MVIENACLLLMDYKTACECFGKRSHSAGYILHNPNRACLYISNKSNKFYLFNTNNITVLRKAPIVTGEMVLLSF